MKHRGPFRVRRVTEHQSGVVTDEQCLACGSMVRRIQHTASLPRKRKREQPKKSFGA
jgi:hypothetical protein